MSDPIRNRQGATQPMRAQGTAPTPGAPPAPAPAPTPQLRMQTDSAVLSQPASEAVDPSNTVQSDAADKGGIAVGAQTFVQGATRGAAQVSRARGLLVAANLAEGDGGTIGKGVEKGVAGVRTAATRVAPQYADEIARATAPLLRGLGGAARVLGKVAPVLNVLVAGYDTAKAVGEKDPAKQNAAWANAGLSVGGTALAVGGVLVGATPVGWALGAGAAAVAAFQLVDTFAFDGKGTAWLGENVAKPVADGAKKVWNAITSL
ncbi:MAG: hypothetical protein ACK46X_08210 [Candidatus Sericytochromatia bacterium]